MIIKVKNIAGIHKEENGERINKLGLIMGKKAMLKASLKMFLCSIVPSWFDNLYIKSADRYFIVTEIDSEEDNAQYNSKIFKIN